MIDAILIAAGLIALYFGGNWLVAGAISLAARFGLSAFIISVVIVGFGTSMPELLVSVQAAFAGLPAIALGNVIGSNVANILLIGGIAILLAPMAGFGRAVRFDTLIMVLAAVVATGLLLWGVIPRFAGFAVIALLAVYLASTINSGNHKVANDAKAEIAQAAQMPTYKTAGFIILGLALLFAGADMLVRGAVSIAREFGISEAVIGLTIVAVGTSLPELATTIVAAIRKQADVAIGNIIGSNIFNILGILGITIAIKPIVVAGNFRVEDGYIMLAITLIFATILFAGVRMGRILGLAMLASYIVYTVWLFVRA